jgi:hypothetical protein
MELLIPLILSILILIFLFKVYTVYQLKNLDKLIEKKFRESIPTMYIEVEGNTLYLYEEKTNTFQCQASTIEELAKLLLEIKNTVLAKVIHDSKEVWFVSSTVLDEIILKVNWKD